MPVLAAAVLLAALAGVLLVRWLDARGPTAGQMARTVVTCGDFSLTNTELGYYYWSEYFYFLDSSGGSLPASLDTDKPLDKQSYDADTTWQDHLLEQALDTVRCTMSMVFRAGEEGFGMPEEYRKSMENVLAGFSDHALSGGYQDADGKADVEAYLRASYGDGATLDSFTRYLENSYLAAAYSDELYARPTFTAQQISDYYDDYAGSYQADGIAKDDELLRNLRVVLTEPDDPESKASWNAAEQIARSRFASWQAGGATEDALADLAVSESDDDETSASGGVMQDISRKDLSGELLGWAFDPSRKRGDAAVLRTDDGWVIAYFSGLSGQTRWQQAAQEDLRRDTYNNAYTQITQAYTFLVDYKHIRILEPDNLRESAEAQTAGQPGQP